MSFLRNPPGTPESAFLLFCRLVFGGLLLLAGGGKLMNPGAFALAIDAFKLPLPPEALPVLAFVIPWAEVIAGALLVVGWASREAAAVLFAMMLGFTGGIISVIARDLPIDCGCFGNTFDGLRRVPLLGGVAKFLSGDQISMTTVLRNATFLGAFLAVLLRGGGRFALESSRVSRADSPASRDESLPQPEAART
ncbi:MAG: DoxX family membrane protein [Candidatus Sumerlaeia bacterium]|nr:DoxX family membrane protein [Candidatus Sumerlaeia bacterium]